MTKAERRRLCAACRAMFPGQKIPLFRKDMRKKRLGEQEQERLTKKGETARIREECVRRSGGYCECGCGVSLLCSIAELDHFFGRGRAPQSVENCWLLSRRCHLDKTENMPFRYWWDASFRRHCEKYGYPYRERFGGRPKADAPKVPPDLTSFKSSARESR